MLTVMKTLIALALASTSLLAGCIVHTHDRPVRRREVRACGPAHHWNGGECVHNGNGNGKGHDKHD